MDCNENTSVDVASLDLLVNQCPMVRTNSYPFTWGVVSESITEGVGEKVGLRRVDFELAACHVYSAFPSRERLVDLFSWMYHCHPHRHHTFVPNHDGIVFPMSVICLRAEGERQIYSLRSWLGDIFIPVVWPDLLREGMKIITERRARVSNPESLEELLADRSYLGEDPTSLSFYK